MSKVTNSPSLQLYYVIESSRTETKRIVVSIYLDPKEIANQINNSFREHLQA